MKKWRPHIQSDYSVVDTNDKLVPARAIIATLESLEAELSAARGEIEHKRESISMLVLDAKRLEDENERLKSERLDFENREGAICPEDVGFEEYIRVLEKRVEDLEDKLDFHGVPTPKETP